MKQIKLYFYITLCVLPSLGCGRQELSKVPNGATQQKPENVLQVVSHQYNATNHSVELEMKRPNTSKPIGENMVDVSSPSGAINYATAQYSAQSVQNVQIHVLPNSPSVITEFATNIRKHIIHYKVPAHLQRNIAGYPFKKNYSIKIPPRGVWIDHTIIPLARISATPKQKVNAVLREARSKLGTPYIWGHNEDRGQYGFDCSNFTEYVYHHALGYRFTTSSKGQYFYVGDNVPIKDMLPGDLLIFEKGKHVGIYAGNGQMIEEGGGLGKVGYLSIKPGSYWGNHLSAVRRMF